MSKSESEAVTPPAELVPEAAPKTLAEIQADLRALEAKGVELKLQSERETQQLAEEIVDLERGNRKLQTKNLGKGATFGSAYQETREASRKAAITAGADHEAVYTKDKEVVASINKLRADIVTRQKTSTPEAAAELASLLVDLDATERNHRTAIDAERDEASRKHTRAKEEDTATEKRLNEFAAEQDATIQKPREFATKNVLDTHKAYAGKDFSLKKGEIARAVEVEDYNRSVYAEALLKDVPIAEEYLTFAEKALGGFEKTVEESRKAISRIYDEVVADLNGESLRGQIEEQQRIKEENRDVKWYQSGDKVNARYESANQTLRALKQAQFGRIYDSNLFHEPYEALREVSILLFENNGPNQNATTHFNSHILREKIPDYKFEQYRALADKYPKVFKDGIGAKLSAIDERVKACKTRREAIQASVDSIILQKSTSPDSISKKRSALEAELDRVFPDGIVVRERQKRG